MPVASAISRFGVRMGERGREAGGFHSRNRSGFASEEATSDSEASGFASEDSTFTKEASGFASKDSTFTNEALGSASKDSSFTNEAWALGRPYVPAELHELFDRRTREEVQVHRNGMHMNEPLEKPVSS